MTFPHWLQRLLKDDDHGASACDVALLEYEKSREAKREQIRAVRTRTQELHAYEPAEDKETTGPVVVSISADS